MTMEFLGLSVCGADPTSRSGERGRPPPRGPADMNAIAIFTALCILIALTLLTGPAAVFGQALPGTGVAGAALLAQK